jgi:Flp pilus assembly protein TadB
MDALVIPLHLGALHPVETLAMGVLALGPFVILAVVVTIVSRRDRRAEARERAADLGTADLEGAGAQATRERSARWEAANSATSDKAASHSVQE